MNNSNDLNNRTLSLQRTIDAPVQLVWEAWAQPGHIAHWWGPKGMKTKVIEHDFKVGGAWKFSMEMPNGAEFISEGVFSEIILLKKIVTSAEFKPMTSGVELQAIFEASGEKTNFTFNVVHPTEEYCRQQEKMGFMNGWGSVFDNLKEYVQSINNSL
ncbi:MAG: SRPBCC domain-containing protein [Flavobacteriaceae bacterium]|nr:SRPBCC domain-containing protein [Flavobacteriaceae bacterium]